MTDLLSPVRRGTRAWWLAAALAALFLAGHLPFLASTLEDIDSVNFALGLRDFDPARHRPHPPGYPIYIALGKTAASVMSEPHALAVWGALFGALAAFALLRLFACLDALDDPSATPVGAGHAGGRPPWLTVPLAASLLTMTAPLYWITALRPMSDMAGLAVTLAAQAILLTALVQQSGMRDAVTGRIDGGRATGSGRLILAGAFACAIAIGFRSQAFWLTIPLLITVILLRRRTEAVAALVGGAVWFVGGVALWFVPLVVASGGPSRYVKAFSSQAGEDWTGVDLLITHPTPRKLASALYETVVLHWGGVDGWMIAAAAAAGALVLLLRRRRALLVLAMAYVPYGLFHLGFQETVTTRYALPLVPPLAYLAVRGLMLLGRHAGPAAATALSVASLVIGAGVAVDYAHDGSPTSRVLADVVREAGPAGPIPLGMHHPFARPVEANAPRVVHALLAPPKHEWLELVKLWTSGGSGPVWFLADPKRTDLALIDPQSREIRAVHAWPFAAPIFLGGIRPDGVQLIRMRVPGWIAAEGWSLTPETTGLAKADRRGLEFGPIVAWVKRRAGDATLMIGGRHLGSGSGPTATVSVRIDGREIATWPVTAAGGFFLRFIPVPAGTLAGSPGYAKLEVAARVENTPAATGIVAIEQFDVQDAGTVLRGFDAGWQEPEYNPATGLTWRWASARADIRTTVTDRDLEMTIVGESPLRYFPRASQVVVKAGARVLHTASVNADFAWTIRVPAAVIAASGGVITLESDQSYRPADRGQNQDRRSLALRIYAVDLRPASSPGTGASSRTAGSSPAAAPPPPVTPRSGSR